MSGRVPEVFEVEAPTRVEPYRGKIVRVESRVEEGEEELLEQLRGLGYIQ